MKATANSSVWAGILAAVAASSCCILPLLAAFGGISSGAASSLDWIAPLRPYLIAASIGIFGFSFYRVYRPKVIDDCCSVKTPFWSSKGMLWVTFVLAIGAMTFPYYAHVFNPKNPAISVADLITAKPNPVPDSSFVPMSAGQLSFYQTPLVCGASSDIGCGSRSKPLLLDLESEPKVKGAWLNHGGTLVAIAWQKDLTSEKDREQIIKTYGNKYAVTFAPIPPGVDFDLVLADFNTGSWYKGSQVDQLSRIEAGIIADKVIRPVKESNFLTPEKTEFLRTEVEAYFRGELVKLRSKDELYSDSLRTTWQSDVENLVAKYVGQERLPKLRLQFLREEECKDKKNSCCKPSSGKSCCKQ